jgi:hypothetical protein
LPDKPSLQDLLEVQKHFDLPSPVLIEKDWYIVRALAAINAAEVKPFRLVFSGGTALSRAHRLIRRMSEDLDLKIVSDEPRSRPELRQLRDNVTSALTTPSGSGWISDWDFDEQWICLPGEEAPLDQGGAGDFNKLPGCALSIPRSVMR